MSDWLLGVVTAFDGSDIIAFFVGVFVMIFCRNVMAWIVNKDKSSRHIDLPRLNKRMAVWITTVVVMLGILWTTAENSQAVRQSNRETRALAVRVCEDSKVSGVERKAIADLFFAARDPRAQLPQDDPVRKAWAQDLLFKYLATLEDAAKQRTAVQFGGHVDPAFWGRYFAPDVIEPRCD